MRREYKAKAANTRLKRRFCPATSLSRRNSCQEPIATVNTLLETFYDQRKWE
jgi:hypothetical protein